MAKEKYEKEIKEKENSPDPFKKEKYKERAQRELLSVSRK